MKHSFLAIIIVIVTAGSILAQTTDYPLNRFHLIVRITSNFCRPRLVTQRKTLVPFAFDRTQPGTRFEAAETI